ncbi:portal protein [Bradyrhizobium sp.]|uniref:portal protein n=1 Tax=Bradyrhizobium sp. TaxID=376 RepID=UPI003C3C9E1D
MAGAPQIPAIAAPNAPAPAAGPAPGLPAPMMPPPPPQFHDVTIISTRKLAQARVMGVPPEEFGIERAARDIKTCNYCFHDIVTKTEAELIAEGYDEEQIKGLTTYTGQTDIEVIERDTVQEHMFSQAELNPGARVVKITEHYVRLDYDGKGRPSLYQVVTGGDQGEILKRDGKPAIEPFDAIPFAATTPVPMTHRFFGRSMADLVMPTQREKTALKRGALDNLYLHNNPRVEVAEANAGPNTLDDLLVSRPGGVIRVKTSGGINWQEVPDVTASVFPAMQYLDAELASRTGLNKQAQGIDANALQNQSATAVNQVFSASQMRLKLVARIMAEGVRDIFSLLHATIRKHGQQAQTVKIRNAWVNVDPRGWKTRDDMTVNVGLGTGGKAQQFAQTMAIANVQKELVGAGKTNLVGDKELYNTAVELTRIMGHKNAGRFFKDPSEINPQTGQLANAPPPPKPDPKVQAIQAQAQVDQQAMQQKAQLEQQQAQLDAVHQHVKSAADVQIAQLKAELEARLKVLDAHIQAIGEARAARHDNERHRTQLAGDVLGVVATAHAHDISMAHKRADHEAQQGGDDVG